jgi:YesN/AraC family two-component response regulator
MKTGKILVVDDQPIIKEILSEMAKAFLEKEAISMEVISFDNALDAQEYIKENHVDIRMLISDIEMPYMTGLDLLGFIKEHFPHIACIMLSGNITREYELELQRLGADHYAWKPLELAVLKDIIKKYLVI